MKKKIYKKQRKNKLLKTDEIMSRPKKKGIVFTMGIRRKIFICFMVPIIFIIVVGVSAYRNAADGLSRKYQESTQQTIHMAVEYINMSCSFIESEAAKYAYDTDLAKYFIDYYENDAGNKVNLFNKTNAKMVNSKNANPFISNIHVIPKSNLELLTTQRGIAKGMKGFFEEYQKDSVKESSNSKTIPKWVDRHEMLYEKLGLDKEEYILSYQLMSQSKTACVVVDTGTEAIREFLSKLDLGEGSIIGFVTSGGRELIIGNEENKFGDEAIFYGKDFYNKSRTDENIKVEQKVQFHGESYQYIYSRSTDTDIMICALVPSKVIVKQAERIRILTIELVVLAGIIALLIGIAISTGIVKNMKRISLKLEKVSEGELTGEVDITGRDEFRDLAVSVNNMIRNTKRLVQKVSGSTNQLDISANEVGSVSHMIDSSSKDITLAIADINHGMSKQSEYAQECVAKTDSLSGEMQIVGKVVEKVGGLANKTNVMINRGMEIVKLLGERAQETNDITGKVGKSIESLKSEVEIINAFAEVITNISSQTNLLSLNASIEAARAGEAGKGFVVVAEEIRKLADDSAVTADKIRGNVINISSQAKTSVQNAIEAEKIVALQSISVEEVVEVFCELNQCLRVLFDGLNEIIENTEKADKERRDVLDSVRNISGIIEETANNTERVSAISSKLLMNVENLNHTAEILKDNMTGLKSEVDAFKTD